MIPTHILAVDQSTQATKAMIFDRRGTLTRRVTKPHRQFYPAPGRVEHDPLEILANTRASIAEVVGQSAIPWADLACLSITNQRETILAWDAESGLPVHNALVWQDERGAALCASLAGSAFSGAIREKTGLMLDSYYSASKLAWIVAEVPMARRSLEAGRLMAGTIDAWLVWNLSDRRVFATDYSNASRTMLFDFRSLTWDAELLRLFGLEGIRLPEPRSSDASFGEATIDGFPTPIPMTGVMGDSHATLFGHRLWTEGEAKSGFGTGSSIMVNIGSVPRLPPSGLVLSLAWGFQGRASYVFEGNIHSTGYTMRWLRDNLGLFTNYEEAERMAMEAGDNGGVYLVPAYAGLGAPWWEHGIRALITGLSHGSDKKQVVRAGLESIAYQVADLVSAMDSPAPKSLACLYADGGPSRNAFLMQFQADILGLPVLVPEVEEISALGAAFMGGMTMGLWSGPAELASLPKRVTTYSPKMAEAKRVALLAEWHSAVEQAISRKIDDSGQGAG